MTAGVFLFPAIPGGEVRRCLQAVKHTHTFWGFDGRWWGMLGCGMKMGWGNVCFEGLQTPPHFAMGTLKAAGDKRRRSVEKIILKVTFRHPEGTESALYSPRIVRCSC